VDGIEVANDSMMVFGRDVDGQLRIRCRHQGNWSDVPTTGLPPVYTAAQLLRYTGGWLLAVNARMYRWSGAQWEALFNATGGYLVVGDHLYERGSAIYEVLPNGQRVEVIRPAGGSILAWAKTNNELLVGGDFTWLNDQKISGFGRFNNGVFQGPGLQLNSKAAGYSFCLYRDSASGDVLVGGEFDYAGGLYSPGIARWTGQEWQAMSKGFDNRVRRIVPYQGQLYAVGSFTQYNNQPCKYIARWNGNDWEPVAPPQINDVVRDAVVWNNRLYLCGDFSWNDQCLAVFDGNQWAPAGPDISENTAYRLRVFDNQLYAGFQVRGLYRTNAAGGWESLGGSNILDFDRYEGKIYAACLNSGLYVLQPDLSWQKINGSQWDNVWRVFALGDRLYVADQANGLYQWIDGQWKYVDRKWITDMLPDGDHAFLMAGFIHNVNSNVNFESANGIVRMVEEKPVAGGDINLLELCPGASVQLRAGAREISGSQYDWVLPGAVWHTPPGQHAIVSFPAPGLYPVQLTVSNAFGADTLQLPAIQVNDCTVLPDVPGHWAQWPVSDIDNGIISMANMAYEQPFESVLNYPLLSLPFQSNSHMAFIDDAEGKGLLFADYYKVYDRNAKVVYQPEQWDLINGTQGALFLPAPEHPDRYYLFYSKNESYDVDPDTSHDWRNAPLRLKYLLVDASVDTATQLLESDITVLEDTLLNGVLQAIPHGNGQDWWILHHAAYSRDFYLGLLTQDGLQYMTAVDGQYALGEQHPVQTIFSPDGRWLAMLEPYENVLYTWAFDRCSGSINPVAKIQLPKNAIEEGIFNQYVNFGGCAFSANGRYLYAGRLSTLFRIDMEAADPAATLELIPFAVDNYGNVISWFQPMTNGPNGDIYFAYAGRFAAISQADGPNPQVSSQAVSFRIGYARFLPNIPQYLALQIPLACREGQDVSGISPQLFPNPGDGHFYIDFPEKIATGQMASLQLFNAAGHAVFDASVPLINRVAVDLPSNLPPGTYFIHIVSGKQKFILKAVIQR
jgi:hypothetical protein